MAISGVWGPVKELRNLSIGFGSNVKIIEHNVFEITGDISIDIEDESNKFVSERVEKLYVTYNHDGLLERVYDGKDEPDLFLLIRDVESYTNSSYNGVHFYGPDFYDDVELSDDNSIRVSADIYVDTLCA